jgi:hypothetical protein
VRDFATLSHALSVTYEPEFPAVNWIVGFNEGIARVLFNKHPCWQYEGESRIVIYNQAGRYLPFKPSALRAIILAARTRQQSTRSWVFCQNERTPGIPPLNSMSHDNIQPNIA